MPTIQLDGRLLFFQKWVEHFNLFTIIEKSTSLIKIALEQTRPVLIIRNEY